MLAEELIDNDDPLLITNSDQLVDWDSNQCMYAWSHDEIDGGILTFHSTHPKFSFAEFDKDGFVKQVAEKKPISCNATVGIYYWKKGSVYVQSVKDMIAANDRTNGEFYIAPTYNYAINRGAKIRGYEVPKMQCLGTPEDLQTYLKSI